MKMVDTEPVRNLLRTLYPQIGYIGDKDQSDLKNIAHLTGVSARQIQRIVKGKTKKCRLDTADKICVGLGYPTAYVFLEEYGRCENE